MALGATLAEATGAAPALFPEGDRALIAAGEGSGGLPAVFAELAATFELRLMVHRRMLRACVYPAVLLALAFFLLPLSRLVQGGMGAYLTASLLPCVLFGLGTAATLLLGPKIARALLSPQLRSHFLRKIPLLGGLYVLRTRAIFARLLAAALRAGLEVDRAILLAARATDDALVIDRIERSRHRLRGGDSLEHALEQSGLFDDDFLMVVAGGETAGRLDVALADESKRLQETVLHRLELLVQIAATAVLLGVYAVAAWRTYAEYQRILGGSAAEMHELLNGLQLELPGTTLPPELQ